MLGRCAVGVASRKSTPWDHYLRRSRRCQSASGREREESDDSLVMPLREARPSADARTNTERNILSRKSLQRIGARGFEPLTSCSDSDSNMTTK
jgi:hypothetical protein